MTFLIFLIFPTREVVESLCKQLEYYAFKIVRQGEEGDHLFVLEAALDLFGCQLGSLMIFN
jgi:transcriptional regulator of NAD metabolism